MQITFHLGPDPAGSERIKLLLILLYTRDWDNGAKGRTLTAACMGDVEASDHYEIHLKPHVKRHGKVQFDVEQ